MHFYDLHLSPAGEKSTELCQAACFDLLGDTLRPFLGDAKRRHFPGVAKKI